MTNLTEPPSWNLPDTFFIFVNFGNPMTARNYRFTKTFSSRFAGRVEVLDTGEADPMPFIPNPDGDPQLTSFVSNVTSDYEIEWNAELGRKAFAPGAPSRMSALYAFGDLDSCRQAARLYQWPLETVRRFELVAPPAARIARVNMGVISLMRGINRMGTWDQDMQRTIWSHYWGGRADLTLEVPDLSAGQAWRQISSGLLWEYLIEGVAHSPDDTPVFTADGQIVATEEP